jgi:hypothetical protein
LDSIQRTFSITTGADNKSFIGYEKNHTRGDYDDPPNKCGKQVQVIIILFFSGYTVMWSDPDRFIQPVYTREPFITSPIFQ